MQVLVIDIGRGFRQLGEKNPPLITYNSILLLVSLFCQTIGEIYPNLTRVKDENLVDELYQLVVRDETTKVESRICGLAHAMEYLTTFRCDDVEELTLLTVAALHSHDEVVRALLACDPSNEQLRLRGTILNEDQTVIKVLLHCIVHVIEDIFMWRRHSSNWAKPMSMKIHRTATPILCFCMLR